MHPEAPRFASRALRGALRTLDAWLAAPDDHRALALVGPPGIGASTLLAAFRTHLASCDCDVAVPASPADLCAAQGPAALLRGTRQRAARGMRTVVLLDGTARSGTRERDAIAALRRADPALRVVLTAGHTGQFDDVVEYAVPVLAGPAGAAGSGPGRLTGSEIAAFYRHRLAVHRPAAEPEPAGPGALGRLCAASSGIPSEVDALARLVAVHGPAAVDAALRQEGPRHRLADLLGDLGPGLDPDLDPGLESGPASDLEPGLRPSPEPGPHVDPDSGDGARGLDRAPDRATADGPGTGQPPLSDAETAALAVLFTAPGGASARMLGACLPHADTARLTASLVARGLVWSAGRPANGRADGDGQRFHLRVTALPLARRCARRPGVPIVALHQAQAEHLAARVRSMAGALCTPEQPAVLAEFRAEQPNLLCAAGELLNAGRHAQAVRLMLDALPLLARTCAATDLLPYVLRARRESAPAGPAEDTALRALTARVLLAAGEQEAAAVCVESAAGPPEPGTPAAQDLALSGVLAAEDPAYEAVGVLMDRVRRGVADRDLVLVADAAAACFTYLMRGGEQDRVEAQCRRLLYEATCHGDDWTAGLLLLWRAAAAAAGAGTGPGGTRCLVDRALAKLRRLGPDALLAALSAVLDRPDGPALRPDTPKLAMVLGALGRADWPWAYGSPSGPLLPRLVERLAADCDPQEFERWRTAGERWAVPELVCDALRGRWAPAHGERPSGVPESDPGERARPHDARSHDARPREGRPREERSRDDARSQQVPSQDRPHAGRDQPDLFTELPGLTRREAEVARLVALGLTNKQIARRLDISEWTAINHLRQVMRKSGCGSRVHVANWIRDTARRMPDSALPEASPAGTM